MNSVERMVNFKMLGNASFRRTGYLVLLLALPLFILPDTSLARVTKVFGPENFVRSSGAPAAEERQFEIQYPNDSNFNLHVFYGGVKSDCKGIVPSAVVKLNGRTVVGPNELNRNKHYIKKQVRLSKNNLLSVELRGRPGSGVRVVITGKNQAAQLFDLNTEVIPDAIELFGLDLNYTWTVVNQPEGGNATFSHPYESSTSLRVDRPGGYILLLQISGATWTEFFPVKLTATEYPIFIPVPVQTRVISGTGTQYQDFSIKVGPHTYTAPAPASCGSPSYEGFQILVLDRGSLALKDHRTFNMPCGKQGMTTFLTGLDNTSIVIVSSLRGAEPTEVCDLLMGCTLGTVFETFGGTPVYSQHNFVNLSYTLPDGTPVPFSYSLIGIKGVGIYNGTEMNNYDHMAYKQESKINSNISGYFVQDDSTDHWTFVYPEFIEIETRSQPGPLVNTIKIGNTSYHSRPLMAGAVGGFQVLWLDQDTLEPAVILDPQVNNLTFSTNAGAGNQSWSDSQQTAMLHNLAFMPEMAEEYGQKLIAVISSIGTPIEHKSPEVFDDLARIVGWYYGGTTGVFNQLGTSPEEISTYSLVGMMRTNSNPYGPGAVDSVEASSTWASLKKENLRVVVHKDKQGFFMPATTYAGDEADASYPDFNLLSVALQAPTSWPLPNPADPLYEQQQAAYEYISSHVGEGLDQTDIRSCYAMGPNAEWQSNCNSLEYSRITPTPNFTESVFEQMRTQLCDVNYGEFNYITHVNGFKDDLNNLLQALQISSGTSLETVYNAVKEATYVDPTDQVKWDALYVIRGMLKIASALDPAPAMTKAMGVINGAMWLGMHLSKGPGGPDYTSVDTAFSSLKDQMNTLWTNCQTGKDIILGIVKSDWGKLQYVGNKFMTDQANGGWKYSDTDPDAWKKVVTDSLEAYYFQSLLPAAWKIDYLSDTSSIPAPKNFKYNAGGSYTCTPYCVGSSANPTAYWIDSFLDGWYTWYVLENGIDMAAMSGCGSVRFDSSAALRDILFGNGPWKNSSGNTVGVKLNLAQPFFYERWLPSSVYRPPTMPLFGEVSGYYGNCSD